MRNSPSRSRRLGPLLRAGWRLSLALGWVTLLASAALFAFEQSGLARRLVVELLEARLGARGAKLSVGDLSLRWIERGVELRDLRLEQDGESIAIERLHAGFRLDARAPLRRLDLRGGRVLLDPTRPDALAALARGDERAAPSPSRRTAGERRLRSLLLQVRDLEIALPRASGEALELGRLDLALGPAPGAPSDAAPELRARLALPAPLRREAATIELAGRLDERGGLELAASSPALDVESLSPWLSLLGVRTQDLSARGVVALEARGRVVLASRELDSARILLALREGSFTPPALRQPVQEVELALVAELDARAGASLLALDSWRACARFSGRWMGRLLAGSVRAGTATRAGRRVEAWLSAPALELSDELVAGAGQARFLSDLWQATRVAGPLEVLVGLRLGSAWTPGAPLGPALEICARARAADELGARWLGVPPRDERPRVGFPLLVRSRDLSVAYARSGALLRPELLCVELRGEHQSGPVELAYSAGSPLAGAGERKKQDEELWVRSPRVAIDGELERALAGLQSAPAARTLFETFGPAGGAAAVELRISDRRSQLEGATWVRVGLEGSSARWRELPLRASGVGGALEYVGDGQGSRALALGIEGSLPTAEAFRLGYVRREERAPGSTVAILGAESLGLEVDGLDLEGEDREVVAARWQGVGKALAAFGPSGKADVRVARDLSAPGAGILTTLELQPRAGASLEPPVFPLRVRELAGRVLAVGEEGLAGTGGASSAWRTRVVPLVGSWPGETRVEVEADFPPEGRSQLRVRAVGLRPAQEELRAAFAASDADPRILDLIDALRPGGAIDLESELDPSGEAGALHRVHLRRNDLHVGAELLLSQLRGALELSAGRVESEWIAGRLGQTSFSASSARVELGAGLEHASATLQARDVPLDRAHLGLFLEPAMVDALVDGLGWRGRVDLPALELAFDARPNGGARLALRGPLTLTDLHLELGVPLSIGSAKGRIHELVVEDGRVRAFGELMDLYGKLAGRELGPARVLLSHHDTRMSIDALEGSFVRGTLRGLGPEGGEGREHVRPPLVLSMELAPPFPFQLALAVENVDLEHFLAGIFPTSLPDRGRLWAELRLSGALNDLLSIRGSGRGALRQSRLWSIPVMRDLFAQLGLEDAFVFDEMSSGFRLEDGVVHMHDIEVSSPFLKLQGQGTLDLDGTLRHDLTVHYSVVDKLGLLKSILYFLQNTLLAVFIRGDMSRPLVIVQGTLTSLFSPVPDEFRSIPLPDYSRLPERF